MPTVASLIDSATATLRIAGVAEARREASALLATALGRDRTFLFAHPEYVVDAPEHLIYLSFIERRAGREPFHYIIENKEFYGLSFKVSPAVLIPRPETEMLVEQGLKFLAGKERPRFCEVGVGSGCISISMLVNLPSATAVGLEISADAIILASENARRHKVDARVDLRRSDVFDALGKGEEFDLIVSNPPYISATDLTGLEADVREFEPAIALTDNANGFQIIEEIVSSAPLFLKAGGQLMLEFGFGQAEHVEVLFSSDKWKDVVLKKDFQDIPRTVTATLVK